MKKFLSLILVSLIFGACTQKYQTYHVIDKMNFNKDKPETPITGKMYPERKVTRSHCEGQIFFSSNAKKVTDKYVGQMVKFMCPDSKYIINGKLTETWWTTIIYSRSCVEMEAYCPRVLNNN